MEQALAFGSVLPAAVGAGCCVAGSRIDLRVVAAMALMVLGMADVMLLGAALLPLLGWAVLFAGLAVGLLVARVPLARERALHLGVMAALTAILAHPHGHGKPAGGADGTSGMSGMAGMEHAAAEHHGQVLLALAVAIGVGYTVYAVRRMLAERGVRQVELAAAAGSALAMAGMALAM